MKKSPLKFVVHLVRKIEIILVFLCCSLNPGFAQKLWGIMSQGGTDNIGTIGHYNISTSTWITDYNFSVENSVSVANPTTELTEANGKFYGMLSDRSYSLGELFEWDPVTNHYTTKITFTSVTGGNPEGALTYANGKLYGMTKDGGAKKGGTLFAFDPATNIYEKLIDLEGHPKGSLTFHDNKLYGMTNGGGAFGGGIIFEWDLTTQVYTKRVDINCSDGCNPYGRLAYRSGKFYGITVSGGVNNVGAIFEWDPAANVITKKVDLSVVTGSSSYGSLTLHDDKFYGMTILGGAHNAGVIFEWNPDTNVYTDKLDLGYGKGRRPRGSLFSYEGKLYGLAPDGGSDHGGALFEWDPDTNIYVEKFAFNGRLVSSTGKNPQGSLAYREGKFYGFTYWGGNSNEGVIFEWNPSNNVYTLKVNFAHTTYTGKNSTGSLTYNNGKFYGITQSGVSDAGGIFEWNPFTRKYSRKIDFAGSDYGNVFFPQGTLATGIEKLVGVTTDTENAIGEIFEWNIETNEYSKKIEFTYDSNIGSNPSSPLTLVEGKYYGMTVDGGENNSGTLYVWDPATNAFDKKIDFNNEGGNNPYGALTYNEGKFYGMTNTGGANNAGVIFMWEPTTNIYTKKFDLSNAEGSNPYGALMYHGGKFYGMTYSGGANNVGVIFEWDPATNVYTKKVDFVSLNGSAPKGSLTYSNSKFYGVTSNGGAYGLGVLFEWDPVTNIYTKKVDFSKETGGSPGYIQLVEADVSIIPQPQSITFSALPAKTFGDASFTLTATASSGLPVTYISSDPTVAFVNGNKVTVVGVGVTAIVAHQAGDEFYLAAPAVSQMLTVKAADFTQPYLFGMATGGGSSQGDGTVFRIKADGGPLNVLHTFFGPEGKGRYPLGKLIQSPSTSLYGMTMEGTYGSIFKITPQEGDLTVLYKFNYQDGMAPRGSLTPTSDGSFFGMTEAGGTSGVGTIFKINADGSGHKILFNFNDSSGPFPSGSLIQTSDGMLFGMTGIGGPLNGGTIFRVKPDGTEYTILHSFDNSASGGNPVGASLLQTIDGKLVGMTHGGGVMQSGVIFQIDVDGSNFVVLHYFNGTNGAHPWGSLIQAPNGILYGTTTDGGAYGLGTIFKINADGTGHSVLFSFSGLDGSQPKGSLILANNKLYGYTTFGGTSDGGVLFNYDLATSSYIKLADLDNSTGVNPERGSLSLIYLPNVTAPTEAARNISFSNILSTSMTVSFTPGNGSRHLVVMKTGAVPTLKPVDGTSYSDLEDLGHGEMIVSTGSENIIHVNALQPYRRYYFIVFEYNIDSAGTTKYLIANAPVANQQTRLLPEVYLTKPGNGAVNQMIQITLKAKPVEGATVYTYEVSTDPNFVNPKIINGSSTLLIDSLQYNTLYYARVKTDLRSDYGKVTTFSTRTAESLAYVTSPANNAVNVPTMIAIASNKVPGASEYTIQLSETNDFSTVAFEATGLSRILHFTGLKNNITYYSRVRVNLSPSFGGTRSFTTAADPLTARSATNMSDFNPSLELMAFDVQVYPNPFQEKLILYIESSKYNIATIKLTDINGRVVHESTEKTNTTIEVEKNFVSGIYLLHANSGTQSKWIRVVKIQ